MLRLGREKGLFLFAPALILLLCAGLWLLQPAGVAEVPAVGGVADLRDADFGGGKVYRVGGEAEIVAGELLTPREFSAADNIRAGKTTDAGRVFTCRLRLLVPEGEMVAFAGYTPKYASRIFVNGLPLAQYGVPGLTPGSSVEREGYITFTARPENGVVELVQQCSNFVFRQSGDCTRWEVGSLPAVSRGTAGLLYVGYITLGCYLLLFFVHLILYLLLPSYRANLFLALLCLVWVLRAGAVGPKVFLTLFPALPWEGCLRLEYLSLPLGLGLATAAYHELFPGAVQRVPRLCCHVFCGGFAAFYLFGQTLPMSHTIRWMEAGAVVMGVYLIARILWKTRRPTAEQGVLLLGLLALLLGLAHDALYYTGVGGFRALPGAVMELALAAFSLLQITALMMGTLRRTADIRRQKERLAMENAALDRVSRMKSELIRTVSHELRTPLAVMSGYAQLVARELGDRGLEPEVAEELEAISSEARRLAAIVEEMHSQVKARELREAGPVSVGAVLRQAQRLYAPILAGSHTALALEAEPDLPPVAGSADELGQVIYNLLSNADRHTENGRVTLRAAQRGDELVVEVEDTGSGIRPEALPHVFERYFHGDERGTGIGLALCKEIVEAHGGRIAIQSEAGAGTRVTVVLPVMKEGVTVGG